MYCKECGVNLEESDKFCSNCGLETVKVNYAGFWIRSLAYFFDGIIISIIVYVMFPETKEWTEEYMLSSEFFFNELATPLLVLWIYNAGLHSSELQSTIGMKLFNLKIVDKNMKKVSFWRATNRFLSEFISTLILFFGYIMIGITNKKQGLHDIIAKTYVVKV